MSAGTYRLKPPGTTGKVLGVLLLVTGAGSFIVSLGIYAFLDTHDLVVRFPGPRDDPDAFLRMNPWVSSPWLSLLNLPSLVSYATIVVWLIWQHQATSNLWARGYAGLHVRPGWAVGWWFIPFANLVMPLVAMLELDRRSTPDGAPRKATPMLGAWWAALLAYLILPIVGFFASFGRFVDWARAIDENATSIDFSPLVDAFAPWYLLSSLLYFVAACLGYLIVRRIDDAQRAVVEVGLTPPARPDRW
jgi:hypothetical protein